VVHVAHARVTSHISPGIAIALRDCAARSGRRRSARTYFNSRTMARIVIKFPHAIMHAVKISAAGFLHISWAHGGLRPACAANKSAPYVTMQCKYEGQHGGGLRRGSSGNRVALGSEK